MIIGVFITIKGLYRVKKNYYLPIFSFLEKACLFLLNKKAAIIEITIEMKDKIMTAATNPEFVEKFEFELFALSRSSTIILKDIFAIPRYELNNIMYVPLSSEET